MSGAGGTSAARLLPPLAVAVFALLVGAVIAVSGDTFGYDFAAYWLAARRLLDGQPLYDAAVTYAVGHGVWLYPPPATAAFLPFALLPQSVAAAAWIAFDIAATVAAIALMPVPPRVRWVVLLLAGLMWPVSYAIKLGQVTPVLLLAFSAAWRWLERPGAVGAAGGLGAVLKLQPGLLLAWAALTRRWRGVAWGMAAAAVAVLVTLPLTGLEAYGDYLALLRRVATPVDTPNNMAPGAIAFGLGLDPGVAGLVQSLAIAATLALVVVAAVRATPGAGLLAAAIGSQLASPVLWDHYAVILLLPVAWLLARGQWWAALVPLAVSVPLVGVTPDVAYPVVFGVTLVAVVALGVAERSRGLASVLGGVTAPAPG